MGFVFKLLVRLSQLSIRVEFAICSKTLVTGYVSMHQLAAGVGMSLVPMITTSEYLSYKAGTI
jgi:hypothetical protein